MPIMETGKIEYPGQKIGKVHYTEGTSLTLLKL